MLTDSLKSSSLVHARAVSAIKTEGPKTKYKHAILFKMQEK